MPNRVVDLREVRDLIRTWEEVRQCILKGGVKGFTLTLQDRNSRESVYFGGIYRHDKTAALKANLRVSWEMTKFSDSTMS